MKKSIFIQITSYHDYELEKTIKTNSAAKTVCITGKLVSFKTKAEAHRALEEAGFRPVESVTKTTDFLVDEGNNGSTKRKKAEELGIKIITNLNTFLKEKTND
jgi:NAD-dependent DNA ligase